MKFAVVFNNEVTKIRDYPEQPVCKVVDGLPVVRPFVEKAESLEFKHDGFVIFADKVERKLSQRTLQDAKDYLKVQAKIAKAQYSKVAKEKSLEKDIADATTIAQLAAIDLTTGW